MLTKSDIINIKALYKKMPGQVSSLRKKLGRSLTLTEKIIASHCPYPDKASFDRHKSHISLKPDRVVMQDATAQMALLQFMLSGKDSVAVPSSLHCDHLIIARSGASEDLRVALAVNREVYDFLESASQRYGIGFWQPGSGIIHQVFFESYAFPGGLVIGTDSHTPNAGGLGMLAIGVGGAEACDVMSGLDWEILFPKMIGVRLTGKMSGWTSPKDVILKLCGILTTKGGTNSIIEYFGPGTKHISATGKATITNMGAELGATTSVFPFDERMYAYLMATGRKSIAGLARRNKELLVADPKIEKEPDKFFDQVVEIDLSKLEPYVVGPHSPDLARPISKLASDIGKNKWPSAISTALIGSCTNSSYEDIGRAASVARQASKKGLKSRCKLLITPGSERIYSTIKRDGQLKALEQIGASVLANACGPCIGQWKRDDVNPDEPNSILTSFNRNFPKRNDGSENTFAFIASPEIVIAMSLYGDLRFNPLSDFIKTADGKCLLLESPKSEELPKRGFAGKASGYESVLSSRKRRLIQIRIKPQSERLQALSPFPAWDGKDFNGLFVLVKARGQCTTDHISPAGKWLQYRGHLDKISDNIFLGAKNEFSDKSGFGLDMLDGRQKLVPEIARRYKKEKIGWVVLGEHNYGEGSSREHAAMSPRYLGCKAVIAKSFARLHETNLKKQGVLPLIFEDASDYDAVKADSKIDIVGLKNLSPGKCVKMLANQADGSAKEISLRHTLNEEQIKWFKAGSALNLIRNS